MQLSFLWLATQRDYLSLSMRQSQREVDCEVARDAEWTDTGKFMLVLISHGDKGMNAVVD